MNSEHIDLSLILSHQYPNSQWLLNGDSYDGLVWLDESPKPTEEELISAWDSVHISEMNKQAQRSRAAAYAIEADPLFFKWQRDEGDRDTWVDKCAEIRARFPYFPE